MQDDGSRSLKLKNPSADRPELFGPAKTQLQQLCGQFSDPGLVILTGCDVAAKGKYDDGTEVDGKKLLRAVSAALNGVLVEGSDVEQFWGQRGMEGSCYRCNGSSCWLTESTAYWWGPKKINWSLFHSYR